EQRARLQIDCRVLLMPTRRARRRSEEVLEPELDSLRKLTYAARADCEPAHTGTRGAERDAVRGVLGQADGRREAGRFHGVAQPTDVLRGKAHAYTRAEHVAGQFGGALHRRRAAGENDAGAELSGKAGGGDVALHEIEDLIHPVM